MSWFRPRRPTDERRPSDYQGLAEAGRADVSPWAPAYPLPLEEIDWGTTLATEDMLMPEESVWPPNRVRPRQDRVELYHDLWRGDVSKLIDRGQLDMSSVAPINVFRRLAKFVADLLVREPPRTGAEEGDMTDMSLLGLGHDLATNMIRYGGGLLVVADSPQGPLVRSVDARYAFPTPDGGWIIAEPRMSDSATSTLPDVLQFVAILGGDMVVLQRERYPTGDLGQHNLGPVLDAGVLGTDAEVLVLPSLPQVAGPWGTSWFDDLLTVVIQIARRMANTTYVLDQHADPMLVALGVVDRFTSHPDAPASSAVQSRGAASRGTVEEENDTLGRLRRAGRLVMPSGIDKLEYVTWDGNLDSSMQMLDWLMRQFRLLSSLPAVLDSDEAVPSGMSLRRMFWQFDAAIAPIFHMIYYAFERAAERFNLEFEWQNVFEVIEESPTATEREDVESEEDATRGANDPAPEPDPEVE